MKLSVTALNKLAVTSLLITITRRLIMITSLLITISRTLITIRIRLINIHNHPPLNHPELKLIVRANLGTITSRHISHQRLPTTNITSRPRQSARPTEHPIVPPDRQATMRRPSPVG